MNGRKWRSGVILVHFPENGQHGCGKRCPFCLFEQINYNIPIKPSDHEILDFISNIEEGGRVQICGAGDPLFNFEKNKEYLIHIINLVHSKGYKIELVTKYVDIVAKYIDTLLSSIEMFCFSTETLDQETFNLVNKATSKNIRVRISKVANFTPDIHEINWKFIEEYIKFYEKIENKNNFSICLRPNFNFEYLNAEVQLERDKAKDLSEKYGYRIYMHVQSNRVSTPQLWNGRQVPCAETEKYAKLDMKLN